MSAVIERAPSRTARHAASRRVAAPAFAFAAWCLLPLATTAQETPDLAVGSLAPSVVEGDILSGPRRALRGIGTSGAGRRWANGEVPYVIDASLSVGSANAVRAAVARWNALSGITLIEHGAGSVPPRDRLAFQSGPGCASWVGRQGGVQEVWVGPQCSAGSVMHEIGHALGLEHEHTRSDRDAHVRINWDRIVPEKRHNFASAPADARLLDSYDLGSIMHYGPDNFSIDGSSTLEPLDAIAGARMGQREAPSAGDIAAIARLYASDLALDMQLDDPRAVGEVTLFVTNESPQGAHDIVVTLAAQGLSVRAQSDDEWRCETGEENVRCALPRLGGNAASHVTLVLGAPLDGATLLAAVSSKTPDAEPGNNGSGADSLDSPDPAAPQLGAARVALADAGLAGTRLAEVPDGAASDAFADGAAADSGGGAPSVLLLLCAAFALARRGGCSGVGAFAAARSAAARHY